MNRKVIAGTLAGILVLTGAMAWASGLLPFAAAAETRTPAAQVAVQSETLPSSLPRTITVVGEGSVKIQPDIARVTIGVETVGTTVKLASTEANATMDAVTAALKKQGILDKDMQTSGFSVWTDRSTGPDGRSSETVTYRVSNNLNIVIRKLDQVGAVIDAAIEAGANSIYGVSFALEDPKSLETEARTKAIAEALAKANELATLNHVQVGQVLSVSEVVGSGGGYYSSNFAQMESVKMGLGGGGSSIAPGELELSLRLEVIYAIQ